MLKVLYLRSTFDPGGIESILLSLYNFKQVKIEFHFIFLKNGSLIESLSSSSNKYYPYFRKQKLDIGIIFKIRKLAKTQNINIIHTHQLIELIYALLIKLTLPHIHVFHSIHGIHNEKIYIFFEKILINFTDKTLTVSESAREEFKLKKYPTKKMAVLSNAVFNPPLISKVEMNWFKSKINYNSGQQIIGMIGNFVKEKDQKTIIKAFKLLNNNLPNLKLVFIGKKSEYSEKCFQLLNEFEKKKVYFLGSIENASKYYKMFDLVIHSSRNETFGIAIIEALMQKVKVISSDIEVFKEISKNGEYFDHFRTGDEKDLALKIETYLLNDDKSYEKSKIESSFEYVKSKFSFDLYLERLESLYKEN